MFLLDDKVIKMFVKLLSRKSNFLQIGLSILFLVLFFTRVYPLSLDWQSVLGIFCFLSALGISYLFLNHSNLVSAPSLSFWYILTWAFVFSDIALDYKLSIALLCSTLIFLRLIVVEKKSENKKFLFDVGLLLSIATFCFPPTLFLFGFLLITYFYKQNVNLRGFLLFIIGLLLPLVLGLQILYIVGQVDWLTNYQDAFILDFWKYSVWGLLPVGLLILMSWFDHLTNLTKQDINKRHNYFISFLYFVNFLLILIFFGGNKIELLMFLGLPISVFLSRLTYYQPTRLRKEVLIILFLLTMVGFFFRTEVLEIYESLLGNVSL